MAAANAITPKVVGLHYDDLDQLFRLKITFELQTPLGNFSREEIITTSDLLTAVGQIVSIWAGHSTVGPGGVLRYQVGDVDGFTAFLTGLDIAPFEAGVGGTPTAPDETPDSDWGHYDGEGDSWGATPP